MTGDGWRSSGRSGSGSGRRGAKHARAPAFSASVPARGARSTHRECSARPTARAPAGAEEALDREIEAIGRAVDENGELTRSELARLVGGRYWGPGRFGEALHDAEAEGRIRRVTRATYAPVAHDGSRFSFSSTGNAPTCGMRGRGETGSARLATPLVLLLAGCGSSENALAPKSHQAGDIANLFWWMMGVAWFGLALVCALLFFAWKRRHRRGIGEDVDEPKPGEQTGWYLVVGAGVIMPIALIAALFFVSDVFVIRTTEAPAATSTRLTVLVIGHQFWWEARYPGTNAVTANEIHIPVRTNVRLEVQTADVIHSFSVPELNRHIDTIPGRTNAIDLYADAPGTYRGECVEFCGVQHAHMDLEIVAQPEAQFLAWLSDQSAPAASSGNAMPAGLTVFLDKCSSCHTIRGTPATSDVGPDLTHLASRTTLGAVTIPNTPAYLAGWITSSQSVKPGNQMPDIPLPPEQLRELVSYLETLR